MLEIPGRFNGPLDSGNGGYCSGVVAELVGGSTEVSLRSQAPLDRPLAVEEGDGGRGGCSTARRWWRRGGRRAWSNSTSRTGRSRRAAGRDRALPRPVRRPILPLLRLRPGARGLARRPRRKGRGTRPGRVHLDAAKLDGSNDSAVRPEIVWGVLDCPTYFLLRRPPRRGAQHQLPGSLRGAARRPVLAAREHVVIGWSIEAEGRKRRADSAVLTADGETLAVADALLVRGAVDTGQEIASI